MEIKRVALIIPHTDVTLESDLQMNLPSNYVIHTHRIFLDEVSEEAEKRMIDQELPKSIDYLKDITDFSAAIFGCTSASAVYGIDGVADIRKLLQGSFNCKATSAFEAVVNQIKGKNASRVALISPYTREVNDFMTKSLLENGIEVSYSNGLDLVKDIDISRVSPNSILEFIKRNKDEIKDNSDLCLVSCTNFRAVEVVAEITEILEMDIVTSNYSILKFLLDV